MEDVCFEEDGYVSLWAGQKRVEPGSDFLRDEYGVEYHDPDFQECYVMVAPMLVDAIIAEFSYSYSFRDEAIAAAHRQGIHSALWVMAQYDFAYDPLAAGLTTMPTEPVFIGQFPWHE